MSEGKRWWVERHQGIIIPIIVALISFIGGWAVFSWRLTALETETKETRSETRVEIKEMKAEVSTLIQTVSRLDGTLIEHVRLSKTN